MNPAIIFLTILGCDDTGVECHYVATSEKRWPTIETCNTSSEAELFGYSNAPYPVVIAVCQKPNETADLDALPDAEDGSPSDVPDEVKSSLAEQAIVRVRAVLPTTEGIRTLMNRPVRMIEDGYSWVARKF